MKREQIFEANKDEFLWSSDSVSKTILHEFDNLKFFNQSVLSNNIKFTLSCPMPVIKPDGSIRACTNLIILNTLVEADPYYIPLIQDIIEAIQGSRYFTLINLKHGYLQFSIRERGWDRNKTAHMF